MNLSTRAVEIPLSDYGIDLRSLAHDGIPVALYKSWSKLLDVPCVLSVQWLRAPACDPSAWLSHELPLLFLLSQWGFGEGSQGQDRLWRTTLS